MLHKNEKQNKVNNSNCNNRNNNKFPKKNVFYEKFKSSKIISEVYEKKREREWVLFIC